nr:poly [ADP-ribose] polymerase 14-like isoform X2 [Pogona vitticeps]
MRAVSILSSAILPPGKMAEGDAAYSYPLIVEGDWGGKFAKNLKYKLTSYFQSRKRSGGGECKIIHAETGRESQITVYFAEEDVRQSVLNRKTHELDVSGGKKIRLAVSLPPVAATVENEPSREAHPPKQESTEGEEPQQPENGAEKQITQEDFSVVVIPVEGKEIDTDIIVMYFENRRAGGGPVKACVKEGQQFIITFENESDGERVLQRKDHTVNKIALHVSKHKPAVVQAQLPMSSSLVVIENVGETIEQCMLILLIENTSDLSEEEGEFSVEMVPERNAAVITFIKHIEIDQFVRAFNLYQRSKDLNLSAHSLEITKSILVENIPPGISRNHIIVYFENKKHGGGPVLNATYVPEEQSALVTFQDAKDLNAVLNQKHSFNGVQVLVHPFYESLDAALYGKERPQLKMPELSRVFLDPYHWQFLQHNPRLRDEISNEMAAYYCELEWPSRASEHPEITMHPSRALLKQPRSLIKTWNDDVSVHLTQLLSKQKVVKCRVDAEVWEAIRNSMVRDNVLIIPDVPKDIVALVGAVEVVTDAEQEMKLHIESAVKKIERERQTVEKTVSVVPGKYTVLNNAGLQERIHSEYPELGISYDASKECISLCGVAAEVFKTKSDILESLSSMAQKSVDVPPYVLLFLQHVDNEQLSRLLFWDKSINAFYELKSEGVLLLGGTFQDLTKAEEAMKKDLSYRCIMLEDKLVIRMKEWNELTQSLYKAYNCSSETIIIHELEDQVVIAGYSKAVADANQKLSDFVDTNTYIQKILVTKSAAVTLFVEQEMAHKWLMLTERDVKINFGTRQNRRRIFLEGPKRVVLEGHQLFQNIISSLHATTMVVDRIGAKAFFQQQEQLLVPIAKQKFRCLVMIQEGTEGDEEERGHEGKGQQCCEVKLRDGIVITVNKGDLTRFPVDVVVNAANEELQHIGGLADALSKVAGPQLQNECDNLVRQHGRLRPGCAVITSAWNLPCKQVIHAVGPRWESHKKEKCIQLLKKAVRDSLRLAEAYNHCSVAIPAISSGIFGFPLEECVHSIVTAIKETLEEFVENVSLKHICLVDCNDQTVQAFSEAVNKVFRDKGLASKGDSQRPSTSKAKSHAAEGRPKEKMVVTAEGLKIILQEKGIEDVTTDVIVNSVSSDLQLNQGFLSKALLGRAGAELQMELTKQGQGKALKNGCVLKTAGYALNCYHVLHVILPHWNQGQNSEEKILQDIVAECLTITEQLSLSSISIPAIGTGNLGFPKPLVAKLMFDEVFKLSQKQNLKSLQEVHFVLHPSDTSTVKAFTDELYSRCNLNQTGLKVVPENLLQSQGVHKMQIGPIKLHVECGDITQETTDAIVNISNDAFNLCVGVSKAILDGAGPEMAKECAVLASQPHNNLICTKPGNLKCKSVIHLVANPDIKTQVTSVLQECQQRQFASVAFPAIGTGGAKRDPAKVADDMIDGIVEFASNTSAPVVKHIKIIIFQKQLLNVFYTSMQKKEAAAPKSDAQAPKSVISRITGFFASVISTKPKQKPSLSLEKPVEPAIFQICGDNQRNVEAAANWVKELILQEQKEMTFSDNCITNFGERELEQLKSLQERLNIGIQLESDNSMPFLRVHGMSKDVWTAMEEVQSMMKSVREGREEQSRADILSTLVEWQYEDQGQYKAFDTLTNMWIESAAQHQRQRDVNIQNKCYTVDPINLCATDAQGTKITLRRIAKVEDNVAMALPEEWEDMQQMRVKVVELNPEAREYQKVKTMFCQTCSAFKIEKIERIQNPYYWQAYQIKKQEMDAKNGNRNNEKLLFHGTASSSLTVINAKGFNRSYAGAHAAAFGNGTYFAVNAQYSAHDTYSTPDANGKKYMYLARVLVGEYSAGSQGLIVPPSKNATDPTDLFDSVTDNVTKPSLFVTFNDIQAYPEYLITFRK